MMTPAAAASTAALLLLMPSMLQPASGFKLVIDSNTMTPSDLATASKGLLRADGSYSIFVNTINASDALWKSYFAGISPLTGPSLQFTEENPGSFDSCKMYERLQGRPPTASMGYHETGIVAGMTLLTDAEIDQQAKECKAPVNVLTRAFCKTASNKLEPGDDPAWIVNTTRALKNPNVFGVEMEFTPGWPNSGQGCGSVDLINFALSLNKTAMLLLPVYVHNKNEEAWENIRDLVTGLFHAGAPMHSDSVILALARYDTRPPRGPVPWWGKTGNTVEHCYDWIQAHRSNASITRAKSDDSEVPAGSPHKPHPLPRWAPTFNMSLSTIIMPCDSHKFITDPTIRKFGVVDLDWSNSKQLWVNESPMQCEENLVKQAIIMKQETPLSKVWVYRDPVLAMPWFTTVRRIMDDEDYRPWFLKFKNGSDGRGALAHDGDGTYHHPVCDHNYDPPKCSDLFHSQTQTPGHPTGDGNCDKACDCGRVPCGMYLFDHRSKAVIHGQSFVDWLVHNLTVSPTGLLHPGECRSSFFASCGATQ